MKTPLSSKTKHKLNNKRNLPPALDCILNRPIPYLNFRLFSLSMALLLLFSASSTMNSYATKYFLSPTGNDNNPGTVSLPFATLNKAWTVVAAGDTVFMRGGIYTFNSEQQLINKNGAPGLTIKVWNYPNEAPVITKGNITGWIYYTGILVMGDYIHIKGLEITGWNQVTSDHLYYGIMAQSVQNCTFELLNIHHNGFGLVIGDWSSHLSTNNFIINCDLHHNSDPLSSFSTNIPWGGADGLRVSTSDPNGTCTVTGTRIWWNSDDGVDLYNNAGYVTFEKCWSWSNGYQPGISVGSPDILATGGNGIGFKLGPTIENYTTLKKRILKNCVTYSNRSIGFDQNLAKCIVELDNNTAYFNSRGFNFNQLLELHIPHISKNNISYANTYSSAPIGQFSPESIVDHCSFINSGWQCTANPSFIVNDADFQTIIPSGLDGSRTSDGSLPEIPFLHLVSNSDLVDAGINVNIPYYGIAPDLGAFEYNSSSSNLAPQILNQSFQINENSPNGTVVGTVIASDPNVGQTLTYSILSGNTNSAFSINSSTGVLSVSNSTALNYETITSFSLIVKVQDNGTVPLSNQATVTITINNLNEAPIINSQTFSVNENSPAGTLVGNVIASDPDAGQILTYSILSGNSNGVFAINSSTGLLTVANTTALNYETTPSFSLVVKVQDNGIGALSSQAAITINLINVNETPVISNQSFSVQENAAVGTILGTVVASDPDAGQILTYTIVSGNTNNAFALNSSNGVLTVLSSNSLNYEFLTSFTLTVKVQDNGSGLLFSQANMTISVINLNEPPTVASNQSFTLNPYTPNGTIVGTVIASDPDAGQSLSYSIQSGNTNSAFTINTATGVLSVANSTVLNPSINPVFNLVVRATDNGAGYLFGQATVVCNVAATQNLPPVINNQYFSLPENCANGTIVGSVTASDPNAGQTLTYSIVSGNISTAFALNSNSGVLSVANSAALDFETNPVFTLIVKVQDNGPGLLSSQASMIINILNVNEPPVVSDDAFSIAENSPNGSSVGYISATDPEPAQVLTYSIVSGNINSAFAVNALTGLLTVANTAAINYEATPLFFLTVKVQDNGTGLLSSQGTIIIDLFNINETPLIYNQSFSIAENSANGTLVGDVIASDPDGGQYLTYSILSGNNEGTFSINSLTGDLVIANQSSLNYETTASYSLLIKVQDSYPVSLSNQATITVNVLNVNEPPVINDDAFSIYENTANGTSVGTVTAVDPDAGQTVTYSIVSGNTNSAFSINATTGLIKVANSIALNYETNPLFFLIIKAQDNGSASQSSQGSIIIDLFNINEPPLIANQTFSLAENSVNGTTVGTIIASDPDGGQTISYSILSGNTNGAFSINSSSGILKVANSSALNFETTPSFALVVKVQDNAAISLSSQATVTVNLINVNEPPVINSQSFSIQENSANGTIVGTVSASDPDAGQSLTYTIISGNTNGAFGINSTTGSITVANSIALNFESTPIFTLTVKVQDNGVGTLSSQAIVTVYLLNVNEVPVIANQSFSINENSSNGTIVGTVAASDPDAGQTIAFSITSGNTNGAFAINSATGVLSVLNSSALNFETTPTFLLTVKVQDNGSGNLFSQANVTINLNNVNEAPYIVAGQVFFIDENSANGTSVGTVEAFDPELGQTITYSIVAGNTNGAFSINSSTGKLLVANSSMLDYETTPNFYLTIKVQDNGVGLLYSQGNITIKLNDIAAQSPQQTGSTIIAGTTVESDEIMANTYETDRLQDSLTSQGQVEGTSQNSFGSDQYITDPSRTEHLTLHVFPNPTSNGLVTIEIPSTLPQPFDIIVLDMHGRTVAERKNASCDSQLLIDISSVPQGNFTILVKCLNEFKFAKIIKL